MRRAAGYGTSLVLLHLLVNVVHGAANLKLHIELGAVGMLFVMAVIIVCPLLATVLLWTSRQRFGLILLALSMVSSLVFGLYNHFVAMGPDHVGQQASGPWGVTFALTACLLSLTEAAGTYIGVHFLWEHAWK